MDMKTKIANYFKYWCFIPILLLSLSLSAQEPCENKIPQIETSISPGGSFYAISSIGIAQSFIAPANVTEIDGITLNIDSTAPDVITLNLYEGDHTDGLDPVIASLTYSVVDDLNNDAVHFQFSNTINIIPGNSYYFSVVTSNQILGVRTAVFQSYIDGEGFFISPSTGPYYFDHDQDLNFSLYKCDDSIPTLEDLCNADADAPVLKETILSLPLTNLSDASGNNNSEIIPGVTISDTNGLCLDNAIVDNFDDLNAVITDPDVLSLIAGFDATPIEEEFDPNNFGIKLDFNLSYFPQVSAESDANVIYENNGARVVSQQNEIVALGAAENPYLEFLGIVYNVITEQVGIYLESGDILYAETNVPLNEWHNVEVKYIGGIGRVFLDGELILWVDTNAIDTEEIDVGEFDISSLTLEDALEFIASYASLGDGYEFCLKNLELYKCVPGATEVPAITEECSVSLVPPTALDNCAGTIVGTTGDPLEYTAAGNYVVNWSFEDGNGNILELTQNVSITTSPETDSDGDGVCDEFDICAGFDDNIDLDGNGIPDGCDAPQVDNCPNDMVNLALLDDATLSGSVPDGAGRGTPLAILYDPLIDDYRITTKFNEYGVSYQENLGTPDADNGYFWRVDWASPKAINYITIGGTYPNQPQPNALWRVSYLFDGQWTTLEEGQGGWIDSGIYEYDGTLLPPIIADAMRVQVYSDGTNDLVSIHLRGRGGVSSNVNDSSTTPKATLFMYLPQPGAPLANFTVDQDMLDVDFDASSSTDDGNIVSYQWDFGDGTAPAYGVNVSHSYASAGNYVVKLSATDNEGLVGIICDTVSVSDGAATNSPDENTNLALLDDAILSGSVPNGDGRGTPLAILYDPLIDDYRITTDFNEYGVDYQENLGRPDADNGFFWQVDWEAPKAFNYVTIGGTYPNQPQPNALWRVSYLQNGDWITLEEGQGGWIDSGIYEWDGTTEPPITADAMRVQVYSDGNSDLVSIHLRGRGGVSNNVNDSATTPKATLIMYLPSTEPDPNPVADFDFTTNGLTVNFDASSSTDDEGIVLYQFDYGDGFGELYSAPNPLFSHTYASPGTYTVTLYVMDADNNQGSITKQVTVNDGSAGNNPDENVNLALLDDATVSGSVSGGRGTPDAILYDPMIDDYYITTDWNEYGVAYLENLGTPDVDDGFRWQVDWVAPKSINYITFGGTYPSQPQYGASWRISYLSAGEWITLDEGYAGWINSGIFEWDGRDEPAIVAEALRVQVYSEENDLVSIHLRGRGGVSNNIDDSATETKATLIQYLTPTVPPVANSTIEPENSMVISPNPSKGKARISFKNPTEVEFIEIYDLTGRKVQHIKGGEIDKEGRQVYLYALPQGIYSVMATTSTGEKYQEKLIIKK